MSTRSKYSVPWGQRMKITILCSDVAHPVNVYLKRWVQQHEEVHQIKLARSRLELSGGDFLFLVSCSDIIKQEHRARYRHILVLHASDLPQGRGWSPHVWEIVHGAKEITLSLLEAENQVDTGRIWRKRVIPIEKTALWYEVNHSLFEAEMELMSEAIEPLSQIDPKPQSGIAEPSYYRRRGPEDSEINPEKSISEQFDLLRMCDPDRYPAWCEIHGQKYKIVLEKLNDE